MPNEKKTKEAAAPVAETNTDRNKANMLAAEQAHVAALAAYNVAYAAEDVKAMGTAEEALIKAEKEFAEAAECDVFARCKATEHPMFEAAKIHSVT